MVRDASTVDIVTIVIEDPARAAVNISTLSSTYFDYFLSTSLLPPIGGRNDGNRSGGGGDGSGSSGAPVGRWIPRPSYMQLEGIVLHDAAADVRLSIGVISARGGASGSAATAASNLVVQVCNLLTTSMRKLISESRLNFSATQHCLVLRQHWLQSISPTSCLHNLP